MSMIREQVERLRNKAKLFTDSGFATDGITKELLDASDTIEKLSAKLTKDNLGTRTNADRIRSMTDEELVDAIFKNTLRDLGEIIPFCKSHERCSDMLESLDGIPEHMCRECLFEWLQQPEGDVPR